MFATAQMLTPARTAAGLRGLSHRIGRTRRKRRTTYGHFVPRYL